MKIVKILTVFLIFILIGGCKQNSMENQFNSELAKKLDTDDYGMKKYTMPFLKRGSNRDLTEEEAKNLQRQHLDNIHKMAEEGTLLLAGLFLDDGDVRGIYIFNIDSVEEAQTIAESDPAVKAGSLELEIWPWYGSTAVMQINEIHQKIAKIKI